MKELRVQYLLDRGIKKEDNKRQKSVGEENKKMKNKKRTAISKKRIEELQEKKKIGTQTNNSWNRTDQGINKAAWKRIQKILFSFVNKAENVKLRLAQS